MSSRNNLAATAKTKELYQIGIRCLAATGSLGYQNRFALYQIGIRCLAATTESVRLV